MPLSLAIIFFFREKMLPNWVLFHTFASLVKVLMASTSLGQCLQAWETTFGKEASKSQQDWNLNGLTLLFIALGYISSKMGQWSEWHLVRWTTLASGNRTHQLGFTKNLSILSWIKACTSLLLVQVNRGLESPISIMLHLSWHSLNNKDLLTLTALPPNLSSFARGSLKSPAITQGMFWRSPTLMRLFHKIYLSALLGLAYTAVNNQLEFKERTWTTMWIFCSVLAKEETSTLSPTYLENTTTFHKTWINK